jgi:hypothetical protein
VRKQFEIAVEIAGAARDARIGEAEAELVARARGKRPLDVDAAVRIEIDQVAIVRTSGDAATSPAELKLPLRKASAFSVPPDARRRPTRLNRFVGWANRQRPQSIAGSVII